MKKIPLYRPILPKWGEYRKYVKRCERNNIYSNFGENYFDATRRIWQLTNKYSVLTSNGTTAIQMACEATLLLASRVMIPDFTHPGTFAGVKAAGMWPLICETNSNLTISLTMLKDHVDYYEAFVVVAPFGYTVDISEYEEFARQNKKTIIYDFAGAWGQFPDTAFPVCYSFHPTKTFSVGEGGVVLFSHPYMSEKARKLTNFNIQTDGKIYFYNGEGNHKMDELKAGMLCAHFENYGRILRRMEKRAKTLKRYRYHFGLRDFKNDQFPSMCVIPDLDFIDPAKTKSFECKHYYTLLSDFQHAPGVPIYGKSGSWAKNLLALPIDVSEKEQDIVFKEIDEWEKK